jgi:carbamoyl-phosphate synthase/aspartate carbamoyltransferase
MESLIINLDKDCSKHLLDVEHFTKEDIMTYILKAQGMKNFCLTNQKLNYLSGKILACIFYEPSTRTSCSFQSAMLRLGGQVITITDKYSSVEKGETLEDTIRTLASYSDGIILRHPLKGSAKIAASVSDIPIINAGDGNGEHPTQALLDIYTIYSELGGILDNEMTITFLGDLKNSRTIHSLIRLLCLFPNKRFIYISPVGLEMPIEIIKFVQERNIYIKQITNITLKEAITITDVLYVTRIQKERFCDIKLDSNILDPNYCIDLELMKNAKEKMIVMHPLPRNQEISIDFDNDPRAVYFRQMKYGLYMRMAILNTLIR